MVYEDSKLDREQIKTVHRLVAQVSRAFFDPPYVIILDKMMTKDVWLQRELMMQCGSRDKEFIKFLAGLQKQRIIKRYTNTEKYANPRTDYQRNHTAKREYWYIDYHDVTNVIKYRLAAIRQRIESSLKKETQKTDYKCLRCGKEYTALDVAFLVATLPPSSGADFALICENCGAELNAKLNEEEQIKEDDKMQRFNEQTDHIRKTLREVEKISFNPIDPKRWLLRHVPETVDIEYDEKGKPITRDAATYVEQNVQIEITRDGDEEKKNAIKAELSEAQRKQNVLPVWHTHSTISGQQTSLGLAHAEKEAKKAEEARLAEERKGDVKVDVDDADLAAHYAKLEAQALNGGPGTVPPGNRADDDDDLEEMPTPVAETAGKAPAGTESEDEMEDAGPSRAGGEGADVMVMVGGVSVPFSQVTEDMQGQMTDDEYMAYAKVADDMEAEA